MQMKYRWYCIWQSTVAGNESGMFVTGLHWRVQSGLSTDRHPGQGRGQQELWALLGGQLAANSRSNSRSNSTADTPPSAAATYQQLSAVRLRANEAQK